MDIGFEGGFTCLNAPLILIPILIGFQKTWRMVRVVDTGFETVFNDIRPDAKAAWVFI